MYGTFYLHRTTQGRSVYGEPINMAGQAIHDPLRHIYHHTLARPHARDPDRL